jgi:hypothetical protein
MSPRPTNRDLAALLIEIVRIEKEYAHELTGAKHDRRRKITELINKHAARLDASIEE